MNIKAVGVISCALLFGFMMLSGDKEPDTESNEGPVKSSFEAAKPKENPEVGDNMNESLRTLLAQMEAGERNNKLLKDELERVKSGISERDLGEMRALEERIKAMETETRELKHELGEANKKVTELKLNPPKQTNATNNTTSSVTPSLGLENVIPESLHGKIPSLKRPVTTPNDDGSIGLSASGNVSRPALSDGIIWSRPDDLTIKKDPRDPNAEPVETFPFSEEQIKNNLNPQQKSVGAKNEEEQGGEGNSIADVVEKVTSHPIYTIPANSTLLDAIAMNSIIGRVPIGGKVNNPFRFKVILGPENLATNGLYIPNLVDVVASGTAQGDFVLECARGDVDSLTYTFSDGTVHTVEGEFFGYISDQWGNSCIPGLYISNFKDYLAQAGSVTALSTLGSAIAESQTTKFESADGVQTSITGDVLSYAGGTALEETSQKLKDQIDERMEDAFDAVFIGAGKKVVINIEKQIDIDYDTKGRRLVHEDNIEEFLQ
ncbi:integrating conjugative element protein [Vibrio harveyi]|uniref:TIGR03752 family integrating conjugative element protein n=1 Tax=Vibrio harveyi TaxID=669 RepID=UPI00084170C4|nr:TIGR03752 family integrating conjugative element protein [Vibrio harveyi]ODM56065.1 integrating conjugative element protein [Vibrio harveyi]